MDGQVCPPVRTGDSSQVPKRESAAGGGEAPAAWGHWMAGNQQQKGHIMKTSLNKLLQGRITRWGFLALLLIAVGVTVAWNNEVQYQLGGGFIGASPGLVWTGVQTPLDPAGRTATLVVKTVDDTGDLAGLVAAFGGNTTSDAVGEEEMISRDTAKWNMVAYAQLAGVTPTITAIFVYTGTLTFTSPDNFVINYTLNVYPASADVNPHDGFPDAGATPALTIPGLTGAARRVPVQ
jgi:hypothetical protein